MAAAEFHEFVAVNLTRIVTALKAQLAGLLVADAAAAITASRSPPTAASW